MKTQKRKAAYIWNAVLFISGIAGLVIALFGMRIGEMFSYYTQDSNIFSMCVSGIYLLFWNREIPDWLNKLRYAASVSLMLTFTVVVFVLGPMYGVVWYPWLFFHGANFFYHLFCPILSFLSFVFFERGEKPAVPDTLIAIIPTLLYAVVLIILNVINAVHGPYPFLYVHEQAVYMSIIWGITIPGIAWFLAFVIRSLKGRMRGADWSM